MASNIQKKTLKWQKKFCGRYNMEIIDLGNGVECEIDDYGSKSWYLNGKLHRTDGPAVEHANGHKWWCLNDKLHRTDGPAIEWADGSKFWYINGIQYSEEDFDQVKEVLWAV